MFARFDSKDRPVLWAALTCFLAILVLAVLGLLPGAAHAQSLGQAEIPSNQGQVFVVSNVQEMNCIPVGAGDAVFVDWSGPSVRFLLATQWPARK